MDNPTERPEVPRSDEYEQISNALDSLYEEYPDRFRHLFLLESEVGLPENMSKPLQTAGLINKNPRGWYALFRVMPYSEGKLYAFSDLFSARIPDRVYPAYSDQGVFFADRIKVNDNDLVLDIGTGSGVLAFRAAEFKARTDAIDTNPRAIALAKFGAGVNKLTDSIQFTETSYADLPNTEYSLIVCNPPFTAVPDSDSWYWKHHGPTGRDGLDVFRGILQRVPSLLHKEDGRVQFLINSLGDAKNIQALDLIRDAFPNADVKVEHLYNEDWVGIYDYMRRFKKSKGYEAWVEWLRERNFTRVYRMLVTVSPAGPRKDDVVHGKKHTIEFREIFGQGVRETNRYESDGWQEMLWRYGVRNASDVPAPAGQGTITVMLIEDDQNFAADLMGALISQPEGCSIDCRHIERTTIERILSHLDNEDILSQELSRAPLLLLDLGLVPTDSIIYKDALCIESEAETAKNSIETHRGAEELLEQISGIKILRAIQRSSRLSKRLRVILISRFDEKFLIAKAVDAGAFAFVSKYSNYKFYLPDQDTATHADVMALPERALIFRRDALAIQVRQVLQRALRDIAFDALSTHVPPTVAGWVQQSGEANMGKPRKVRATLLLADLRGSTILQQETVAKGRPELFAKLLNVIMSDANEIVTEFGGEINCFTGDGFLAFFNIYTDDDDPLGSAIQAAFGIRQCFRRRTAEAVHRILHEDIQNVAERDELRRIIREDVGVRIGIVTTDSDRSIVATVGGTDRQQHTIISTQMNVLSRLLDAVGRLHRHTGEGPGTSHAHPVERDPIVLITQDKSKALEDLHKRSCDCTEVDVGLLRDFEDEGYTALVLDRK